MPAFAVELYREGGRSSRSRAIRGERQHAEPLALEEVELVGRLRANHQHGHAVDLERPALRHRLRARERRPELDGRCPVRAAIDQDTAQTGPPDHLGTGKVELAGARSQTHYGRTREAQPVEVRATVKGSTISRLIAISSPPIPAWVPADFPRGWVPAIFQSRNRPGSTAAKPSSIPRFRSPEPGRRRSRPPDRGAAVRRARAARFPPPRRAAERGQGAEIDPSSRAAGDEMHPWARIQLDCCQRVDPAAQPFGERLEPRLGLELEPQQTTWTVGLTRRPHQQQKALIARSHLGRKRRHEDPAQIDDPAFGPPSATTEIPGGRAAWPAPPPPPG